MAPWKKANSYVYVSQSIFFKNLFYQQKFFFNHGYNIFDLFWFFENLLQNFDERIS